MKLITYINSHKRKRGKRNEARDLDLEIANYSPTLAFAEITK
jgi:hypothetical protein